jgi:hypothetical protein
MPGYTLSQLAAIEAAIGSGVLRVEHQGTSTTYQNLSDMMKVRDMMTAELIGSGALPAPSPGHTSYAAHSRD